MQGQEKHRAWATAPSLAPRVRDRFPRSCVTTTRADHPDLLLNATPRAMEARSIRAGVMPASPTRPLLPSDKKAAAQEDYTIRET